MSLQSIIPEFGSTAMIAGNYYITFDDVIYNFNNISNSESNVNCSSYILASDFINDKFTIIINYINKVCYYIL